MKFIIVILFWSTYSFAQTLDQRQDVGVEKNELDTYLKSNYIAEYQPKPLDSLNITGKNRMTFAYYMGLVPSELASIADMELQFGYDLGTFWLESLIGQGKGDFGYIGRNSSASSTADSEGRFFRTDEDEESYIYLGLGGGLRSRHLSDLLGFDRIYETMATYVTYHSLKDELRDEKYAGFGVRADLGINYLLSTSSHIGLRMSFGVSNLRRNEAFENEPGSQRSLMFRWNKLGADYSFYF